MRMSRSDIINDNFINANGIKHLNPIIYSHGCNAAGVDVINSKNEDCIAEMMLEIDNFASAYIGNTRYGWFNEGQTEGPSLHLHREFVSALYGDKIVNIGAAHTLSRIRTAPFVTAPDQWEPGALRWCFYGCNVLGDAVMAVWTNQINEFQNVNYPDSISTTPVNFLIQTGVPGSKATLSSAGELIATVICDQNGDSWFNIDSTVTDSNFKLTITALNHKPFITQINSNPVPSHINSKTLVNNLKFDLKPAYPNPFNPVTNIEFTVTRNNHVKLEIFNTLGQHIKTLCNETVSAGIHKRNWDGRDEYGQVSVSGIYFFRLQTDEGIKLRSCILLK